MRQTVIIGFKIMLEDETDGIPNGDFVPDITERRYSATCVNSVQRWKDGDQTINQDIGLTLDVSVVANPWLETHLQDIEYIVVYGSKWQVQSSEAGRPRFKFHIGGAYHG